MDNTNEMQVTLRLPPDLYAALAQLAQQEHRSLQSLLNVILRDAIDTWHNDTRQGVMDRWDDANQPPT